MGHTSIKSTGAFISRLNYDPWTSLKFARFSRLKLAVAFLHLLKSEDVVLSLNLVDSAAGCCCCCCCSKRLDFQLKAG